MPPAVLSNVMLRWESAVLWWFYPQMGLGNKSDRPECRDAGSRNGWMRCCFRGCIVDLDECI